MPSRILREGILTSEPINSLSERAELFYRRLMSVADDYGRYFANPELLRAHCYPLRLHSVTDSHVKKMLAECIKAGLVRLYGGGKYLLIAKFGQQTRSKSRFPEPPEDELLIKCEANDKQLLSKCTSYSESESYSDTKSESKTYSPGARAVLHVLNEVSGKRFRESNESLAPINARLEEPDVTTEGAIQMVKRQGELWKGTKFWEFMRPSTLFGKEKFNEYYAAREMPVSRETRPSNGANHRNFGVSRAGPGYGEAAKAKQLRQQNAERLGEVAGELDQATVGDGALPPGG